VTTLNLFSNRATAKLAADVIAGDTALTLVTGEGARFPALAAGQYFRLVLQKGTGPTDQREYMVCTARAGDVLTVTRAQEGTPAAAFATNDEVSLVATALSMTSFVQRSGVTLQGALEVEAVPSTPLGIATKSYVDTGTLADAPSDGVYYVRRNAGWVDGDGVFATDAALGGKVAKAGDTMTGALGVADGIVSAPGLSFASEASLGMYRPSTSNIGWVAAGALVKTLGAATSTSTYISLNPRAVGGAFLQLVNAPAASVNYNVLSVGVDQAHGYIGLGKNGSATDKPLDFTGAAGYSFDADPYVFPRVATGNANIYLINQPAGVSPYQRLVMGMSGINAVIAASGVGAAKPQMFFDAANFTFSGSALVVPSPGYISSYGDVLSGSNLALMQGNSANPYVRFTSDGWKLVYAAGSLVWQSPTSVNLLTITGGGDLTIFGAVAVKASGTTWAVSSSRDIKHNIRDYTPGLAELLRVRPRSYQLNDDETRGTYQGIVADEVEGPFPRSITCGPDGKALFNADPLFWAMVNALKTLHHRIDELEHQ
jgi:hypothetical protein